MNDPYRQTPEDPSPVQAFLREIAEIRVKTVDEGELYRHVYVKVLTPDSRGGHHKADRAAKRAIYDYRRACEGSQP